MRLDIQLVGNFVSDGTGWVVYAAIPSLVLREPVDEIPDHADSPETEFFRLRRILDDLLELYRKWHSSHRECWGATHPMLAMEFGAVWVFKAPLVGASRHAQARGQQLPALYELRLATTTTAEHLKHETLAQDRND
jgi:hypothetical protein